MRKSFCMSGRALILVALLAILVGLGAAQERFGEINGAASDPSGAVIPGVNVMLTNKGTGRVYTTKTCCAPDRLDSTEGISWTH